MYITLKHGWLRNMMTMHRNKCMKWNRNPEIETYAIGIVRLILTVYV